MPQNVTDIRSNLNDQIANAARIVGRSKQRQAVFEYICRGKKVFKTTAELMKATKLSQINVLDAGTYLANHDLAEKVKGGYKKDTFCARRYRQILAFARSPKGLAKLPTKVTPHLNTGSVRVQFHASASKAILITIDDINSFAKIRTARRTSVRPPKDRFAEATIKLAIQRIIRETGHFQDWGGEKNDLHTTKTVIKGKRRATAFALKGRATKGILTLKSMGKNSDQVIRLFSDFVADAYLIVYQGQIAPVILEQMKALAISKALAGNSIYYGVIDADDIARLYAAYQSAFR